MKLRRRIGDSLPPALKERLLTAVFNVYGGIGSLRSPYEYLFVLAHARSGSSLLAMILGNSPEICGYGETTIAYHAPSDLRLLTGNNLYRLRPFSLPGNERYMMDKLVNEDYLAVEDFPVLLQTTPKIIFLIREPAGALRSMMPSMGLDDTFAAVFYVRRLDILEAYARQMAGTQGAFLLSYEDLTERTETTLDALSAYLALQTPLSESYQVLQPMKGRTAEHHKKLHTGRVDGRVPASPQVEISERNLAVARRAYDRCWQALSSVGATIAQPDR